MSLEVLKEDEDIKKVISEAIRNLSNIKDVKQLMQMTKISRDQILFTNMALILSKKLDIKELRDFAVNNLYLSISEGAYGRSQIERIIIRGLQKLGELKRGILERLKGG